MALKSQGELLTPTDVVNLTAQFYDINGNKSNTLLFPTISIINPSGLVAMAPTSAGVSQIDVGKYLYQFTIPYDGPYGVWAMVWQGQMSNGMIDTQTLNFIVATSDLPQTVNQDGYAHLGDNVGFDYSQVAIRNINKLIKVLSARMNNTGKSKITDGYGNVQYVDCSIFSIDQLTTFLANAITDFNQIPYFTFFTFNDTMFIDQFLDILVEGATLMALASIALLERGKEFTLNDQGIQYTAPTVSELINSQYNTLFTQYYDKLKYIKNSMRPSPIGLGVFTMGAVNTPFRNLRHQRSRRIY